MQADKNDAMIEARDNNCTNRSPCLICPHRDMDKNKCSLLCLRLAAYNSGESWEGKPLPYIAKQGRIKKENKMEDKSQRSEVGSQRSMEKETLINTPVEKGAAGVAVESQKKRAYHKTTIQPGTVKQARGLLNKETGGICLIDDCDGKDKLIRGLCSKHYQAWRKGLIRHPILGEFTIWQAKSRRSEARGRKSEVRDQKPEVGKDIERRSRVSQKATPIKEKKMSKDSKASYYDAGGIETLDIIKAKLTPEQYKGYLLGCSLKYQCRLMHKFDDKDRIRDAEKAANYSLWLLEAFKE